MKVIKPGPCWLTLKTARGSFWLIARPPFIFCLYLEKIKEIKALGEQLLEFRALGAVVEEQADEHGDFIFQTATYMIGALKDWYEQELMNCKNKRR